MNNSCNTAIIGAGPYGLSLAAHLGARGIDCRIFGKPLETWRAHMPKDMVLKSDGFASNLSAPAPDSTLKAWCAQEGLPYAPEGLPIPIDRFLAYADWFQKRFVPDLEQINVRTLERGADGGFALSLDDGRRVTAQNVVLAVGISWFAFTPDALAALPKGAVSHSFDHRDGGTFKGRDVVILGRGASAIDLAAHLRECGAAVRVVARTPAVEFNAVPDPANETLVGRIQRPPSGIGRGWRSLFCAAAPLLFYRLPEALKQRAIRSHMHPAAGWFMRAKVEGRIPMLLGRTVKRAGFADGKVVLSLSDDGGREETIVCDHVIAATGYRPEMRKLAFVAPDLRELIRAESGSALVSDNFETPVEGLYAMGLAAMESFGPLLRFMVGAEFAAPRIAAHLERKAASQPERRAA